MEKEKKSGGMMSVIAALGANILVAISKFVGFAVSGSAAMLNESIHSIVDCGNQILLLPESRLLENFAFILSEDSRYMEIIMNEEIYFLQ